jgi:phosphohistidine phosphatase SixA
VKVWLARHSWAGPSLPDPAKERERPLLPEGIKIAKAIAQAMLDAGELPNTIFTSPFARAIQTSDIYGKAFGVGVNVIGDLAPQRPLTPTLQELLSIKGEEKLKKAMLVGHVDNTTPAMLDLDTDGEGWDDLVMGEVRRLRIDRKTLEWDIRWCVKPSDLGMKDHKS